MAGDMEQDPACQECESRPAFYCWAWDRHLCEICRMRRTASETQDGGRHPVAATCSCKTCREARQSSTAAEVTFTAVSPSTSPHGIPVTIGPGGSCSCGLAL